MPIYEYKCNNKHITEKYVPLIKNSVREIECPHCGEEAKRLVSTPHIQLEGITGQFPDAAAKWTKMHTPKSKGGSMPDPDPVG